MGSFGRGLGVIRAHAAGRRVNLGHSGAPYGSLGHALGVVRFCWVHSGASWGSSGSFAVGGFIRARDVGRWIHSGSLGSFMSGWRSLGSFGHALGSSGSFGFVGFIQARPGGLSGAPCRSYGSFDRALEDVGLICVR